MKEASRRRSCTGRGAARGGTGLNRTREMRYRSKALKARPGAVE